MYGTIYDEVTVDPEMLWRKASQDNREKWLKAHRFKTIWAIHKFNELPDYVQFKWEDQSNWRG
jgi:hypothetical protein